MATNLFIFFCSLLFLSSFGLSQKNDRLQCIQRLLPCAQFLKSPSPPPTCCDPLKDAIDNDAECLCDLFNNQQLLKTYNVTQDEALQLPKNCGVNADLGKCKADGGGKGTSPPATPVPPTPTLPTPTPSTPTPSTPSKSPTSSNSLKAANAVATSVFVSFGISYVAMSI